MLYNTGVTQRSVHPAKQLYSTAAIQQSSCATSRVAALDPSTNISMNDTVWLTSLLMVEGAKHAPPVTHAPHLPPLTPLPKLPLLTSFKLLMLEGARRTPVRLPCAVPGTLPLLHTSLTCRP